MKLSTHEIIRIDVNISIDYFVDGRAGKEEQEKDCVIRGKYRWYQAETTRLSLKIGKYYPISEQFSDNRFLPHSFYLILSQVPSFGFLIDN